MYKPETREHGRSISTGRLVGGGLLWLGLGTLVYLGDRPCGSSYLQGYIQQLLPAAGMDGISFGILGGWLPTFCHVVAWSLITAGVLALHSKPALAAICLLWLVINAGFELGQKYAAAGGKLFTDALPAAGIADIFRNYFTNGTYDTGDLLAAVLGAGVAFILLLVITERKGIWSGNSTAADIL